MLEALGRQLYSKRVPSSSLLVGCPASSWVSPLLPFDFLSLVSIDSQLHHIVDIPVEPKIVSEFMTKNLYSFTGLILASLTVLGHRRYHS